MATSTCPKAGCGSHRFEMVENTPSGSAYKLMFIQCASCGTVVGVMDYFNIGNLLKKVAKALRVE
jgi:hypothetical protein